MNPETHAEGTTGLIRTLVETYIDHPRRLELDYRVFEGRTDWRMRGDINDQGKLVGRLAAHIKALKFILAEIGDKVGRQYVLRLEEPLPGERLPPVPRKVFDGEYNAGPMLQLLHELLAHLLVEPAHVTIKREEGDVQTITYFITCRVVQDNEKLVLPLVERDDQTLLDAINVLIRAAGHREGVKFAAEVK